MSSNNQRAVYAAVLRAEMGPVFLAESGDASHLRADLRSVLGRINTTRTAQYREKVLRYDCFIHVHAVAPCSLVFVLIADSNVSRDKAVQSLVSLHAACRARDDLNWMAEGEKPLQAKLESSLQSILTDLNESSRSTTEDSTEEGGGRLDRLRNQVADVRQVMATNVERVLARGERLDDLVDRTEDLEAASAEFRTSAYRVRQQTCWRNAKWNIILATVAGTLLIGLAVFILYEVWCSHGYISFWTNNKNVKSTVKH